MILVSCASDARKLHIAFVELKKAPSGVLKEISMAVQAGMLEGVYTPKENESISNIHTFLTNRGFVVSKIKYNHKQALHISWFKGEHYVF